MDDIWRTGRGYILSLFALALGVGGYVLVDRWPRPEPVEIVAAATESPTATATASTVVVHVVGAVHRPGVYTLPTGSRLDDAVRAAGGLLADADAARINLADRVRDAQQIYVPLRGETPPPAPTPASVGASGAGGAADLKAAAGRLLNVNTASAAQLEALPGIGPAYAARIVAYREANGPFRRPEDIQAVSGIGPARYEQIRNLITTE